MRSYSLAGANRGDERALRETNISLAEQLVTACEKAGSRPHILFANTTHHTVKSPYGESKRIAAENFTASGGEIQCSVHEPDIAARFR